MYENSPRFEEVIEWLRNAGFRVSGLYPLGRLEDLSIHEIDCVAIRVSSIDSKSPGSDESFSHDAS